jgi:hypothetical protein
MHTFGLVSKKIIKKKEIGDSLIMGMGYGLSDSFYKSIAITATEKGIELSDLKSFLD